MNVYLRDLGIAYLTGALYKHECSVVEIDGKPAFEVVIPPDAVPDLSPGLTDKITVRFRVGEA